MTRNKTILPLIIPTVTVKVKVSIDQFRSLLVSNLESGDSPWIGKITKVLPTRARDLIEYEQKRTDKEWGKFPVYLLPFMPGGALMIEDAYSAGDGNVAKSYRLDLTTAQRGLEVLAKHAPHQFGAILSEDADSITADCWLQCALFKELRYG